RRSWGIVIVVRIAIGQPRKQVVATYGLVPYQLAEANILVSQKRCVAVYAVLVMAIGTELKQDMLFDGQLIGAKQFPAAGVDALAIDFVAATIPRCPIHLAAPAVFVNIACSK